jgi:hypothetical protein
MPYELPAAIGMDVVGVVEVGEEVERWLGPAFSPRSLHAEAEGTR